MNINSRYLDWQPIVNNITNSSDLTVLELGCGAGTSYLVDKFKFVISYETNTRDVEGKWFNITYEQNKNKNWLGFFDNTFFPNVYQKINIKKLIDNIKSKIDLSKIDVVFIDPGFRNRAECVLAFADMNKFQYIFTHDTNTETDLYEWNLLEHISNEYKLYSQINTGQGTILWKKN